MSRSPPINDLSRLNAHSSPELHPSTHPPVADVHPNAHMSSYPPPPAAYSTSSLSHPNQSANDNKHDLLNQLHTASAQSYSYDANTRPLQFSGINSIPNANAQQHHVGNGQQSDTPTAAQIEAQKGNRLRKACDSCSIRKVKCDEAGPPCRACAALEIPCTFERPSRRRGPPNRHAESIKRRRLEEGSPSRQFSTPSPSSPSNVAATLASFSSHAVLSAESICPFSILELLVDDFFTYIHPLAPFPHEPSFRAAFKQREDLSNPSFLALLASMIGMLVASFPRKPIMHLKAQHQEKLFPNSISLVERCHKVAVEARGAGYLDRDLTVYDAVTSYFLGLAGAYTINWHQCRLYFGETFTISRAVGVQRANENAKTGDNKVDFIKQEIGRRMFWVMVVGVRSMQQLGASFAELTIPPPTPSNPYPPLPLPIDDQYIFATHIVAQPSGAVSKLAGFNLGIQIYMTCTPLATMELAYGIDELFDWPRQKRVLEECVENVKRTLENIPSELRLEAGNEPGRFGHEPPHGNNSTGDSHQHSTIHSPPLREDTSKPMYYPHAQPQGFGQIYPPPPPPQRHIANEPPVDEKRQLQYEIQKANIYASQLGTRSYLVEKYFNLLDAHEASVAAAASGQQPPSQRRESTSHDSGRMISPTGTFLQPVAAPLDMAAESTSDAIATRMAAERETIVQDLLRVLGSISQVNMEPNGGSFLNKIRQIAATLLDTPRNHKGPLARRAEEYLGRFLDVLMRFEGGGQAGEEEEGEGELRNWADLREYQSRFARGGGFMNEVI
ncbi:hypothetical protein VE02_04194 [Pseudogymnoascus sp. 03VT05]|nr:hypothetical protein VE02_04194 [Pseudogymnoascus sp. 03VT05]